MYNFSSINWGEDDGTGDSGLREYFVEIPEYKQILNGDIRYIIGRKGTGKSAIAEKIRIDVSQRHDWFYCDLSLKDFPLGSFRSLEDKSQRGKSKYVPAWKFLICARLISLILNDCSCDGKDKDILEEFMMQNFPNINVGFSEILTNVTSNKLKVKIPHSFDFELGSDAKCQTFVHYQRATDSIVDLIKNIHTESYFFMIFDDLDEDFTSKDESIRLILLSLFRAIELLYKEFSRISTINFRPVLLLRSDIFDCLRDNDLNKLDDYIFRLNWSKYAGTPYDLKSVVEARIKASLKNKKLSWDDVAEDYDENRSRQLHSLWEYMVNRTYERPRDIIKFLKFCRKKSYKGKLNVDTVKNAEFEYSNWLFRELDDEIYTHEAIWNKASMMISNIGTNYFDITELEKQFNGDEEISSYLISNNKTAIQLIEILFNFGIIGTIEPISKRWIFKYKDYDLPFNKKAKLIVHYGLVKKFRVKVTAIN